MLRSPFASRMVSCLLLMTMSACANWHAYPLPASADVDLPARVRFTLDSGESVKLKHARLEGDSVYVGEVSPRSLVRVPASSVAYIEESRVDPGRTVLAVLGAIGLAFGFLLLGACSSSDFC